MNWRGTEVSWSATHHVREGVPVYGERFDEVLNFREPGLAPVHRGGKAWHIQIDGTAAYTQRFSRTFGFYEGLAAVAGFEGWRHIRADGADAYETRFAWCGNFQGGRCAAREFGGAYLHLTPEGIPAYKSRWRYAGDYRDGIAVVQWEDGHSTHIDPRGEPIHGGRFLDLDVFHKGFARARDEDGWMHIDRAGRTRYGRRFAAVEPFYNGQARVERFDGGLEVIDEAGTHVTELRPALKSEFAALSDDLTGFWRTQAICTAIEFGVFEALPASVEEIAQACGMIPDRARRLLRGLAELGLVTDEGGAWRTTRRGAYLTAAHPWTLAGAAIEYGRAFSEHWEALPKALRRDAVWTPPNVFAKVAADPARVFRHHQMLESYARHDYAAVPAVLDLRGDERVIDAGGGLGALATLVADAHPELRITVLDRPEVVEQSECRRRHGRVTCRAADLFEPWGVQGDAVVLARVLHDWDDGPALCLLRHARGALSQGGRLFVVEMVLPDGAWTGGLCDLHLLLVTGGKERTESSFARLFNEAGFTFEGSQPLPTLPSVLMGSAR